MSPSQKQNTKSNLRAQVKCYTMISTFLHNLAKPDNSLSGGKQPVLILTAEITQPWLKRPEARQKSETTDRKYKTGYDRQKIDNK